MYLLDTNVISELRKVDSGKADAHVVAWANSMHTETLYISVISLFELEVGILQLERHDIVQASILRTWLEAQVIPTFDGRILPIGSEIARRCARLHVPNPQAERDALIAATALTHSMTVVTRNLADLEATGVALINPWQHP